MSVDGAQGYHFWQDFFDTYQSLPDWLKLVWLILPALTFLGLVALLLRYRLARHRIDVTVAGDREHNLYREHPAHHPIDHQAVKLIEERSKERG